MLRRMDGFGGLYPHTQDTIIQRLMETYKDDAVEKWPTFIPPPAPTGLAAAATITMWEMDKPLQGSFHDLEIGRDENVYAVNISQTDDRLNPQTGEQTATVSTYARTTLHRDRERWQPLGNDVRAATWLAGSKPNSWGAQQASGTKNAATIRTHCESTRKIQKA